MLACNSGAGKDQEPMVIATRLRGGSPDRGGNYRQLEQDAREIRTLHFFNGIYKGYCLKS